MEVITKIQILIVFAAILLNSCTSRVEHQPTANMASTATININTATADELEKLPHIGRKTAEMIVQFRGENGPFRRVEQIMQIRGISETRFTEIRQYLKTE